MLGVLGRAVLAIPGSGFSTATVCALCSFFSFFIFSRS